MHRLSAWIFVVALYLSLPGVSIANPNDFSGDWTGSWTSYSGPSGGLSADITQTGDALSGTISLTDTDCGDLDDLPLDGNVYGGNQANFFTYTTCGGSYSELDFTDGTLVNNVISGNYTVYDDGDYYDGGTFTVDRSVNLIDASPGSGGSISPTGRQSVAAGTDATFTITPDSGFKVSDVIVDGSSEGPQTSYTFTNVSANHVISATFEQIISYTITSSAGTGGSIQPAGTTNAQEGTDVSFTISAGAGYRILDVLVDGVSIGTVSEHSFTEIDDNHTIVASFRAIHKINASAGEGGTIMPAGEMVVDRGTSQTFTITPQRGFVVADVLVDGVSVGAVPSYTIDDVQSDVSIVARFKQGFAPFIPALDLLIQ